MIYLRLFFEFLHENNSQLNKMDITAFPLEILDKITREDIEEYMQYSSYYEDATDDELDTEAEAIFNNKVEIFSFSLKYALISCFL